MPKNVFIVGATGFIGEAILKALIRTPDVTVRALARSTSSAQRIRAAGALAVTGDLKSAGAWQKAVAEADLVVHAAQPATFGQRITAKVARRYEAERLTLDRQLFGELRSDRKMRLVYLSGNSFYGETGAGQLKDETMTPRPTGFGPYIQSAVHAAEALAGINREVIVVFPGAVYGRGSWLKQYFLDPIEAGKPVMRVSGPPHWASPILVHDCGRAVAHLALMDSSQLRTPSERFFLVDDRPVTYDDIAASAATALGKTLKTRNVPGFMLGLFAGAIVRSYMETDSKYSNAKLRATGFEFQHPTITTGMASLFDRSRQ
jgi:nucleoside-diphosphate-sugar epimerase